MLHIHSEFILSAYQRNFIFQTQERIQSIYLAIKELGRNVLFSNLASCLLTYKTADCIKKLSCLVKDIIFRYTICN